MSISSAIVACVAAFRSSGVKPAHSGYIARSQSIRWPDNARGIARVSVWKK
ncbi:hypothetical protein ONS87_00100 [Caldimonas thermodepolymerans]|nr:hypothetical protein [Caldimonas thermodepolymerans]UZG48052.1 hypothetical protein ONS87_00100 [Caldimonas thermodepolymerans]